MGASAFLFSKINSIALSKEISKGLNPLGKETLLPCFTYGPNLPELASIFSFSKSPK